MQHSKTNITQLFTTRQQYLIPIFQRGYVWTLEHQVKPLWEDIADRAAALTNYLEKQQLVSPQELRPLQKHFLGTVVLSAAANQGFGHVPTFEVIDGQQRITTLQILLLAFRDVASTLNDDFINQSFGSLTRNQGAYKIPEHAYKIWPTNAGRDEITALINTGSLEGVCEQFPLKKEGKKRPRPLMIEAYLYFYGIISLFLRGKAADDTVEAGVAGQVEQTLSDLIIRSIRHDHQVQIPYTDLPLDNKRAELLLDTMTNYFQIMALHLEDEDDPQVIFETLNARGAQLFPSDLVRNYIFLQATRKGELVDDLYEHYWRIFDEKPASTSNQKGDKYWKQEERQGRLKNSRLDLLLYHYVTLRTQQEIKVAHVFQGFKYWWEGKARQTDDELACLINAASVFESIISPRTDSRFGLFCSRVKALDTTILNPLILHLREHYEEDSDDLLAILTDLESYLIRRFVCGMTTKGYNHIFMRLLAELVEARTAEKSHIRQYLLGMNGESQLWPDDHLFREQWLSRPIYQVQRRGRARMLLEALELGLRTSKQEAMNIPTDLTIEHVLPQGWTPGSWPIKPDTDTARLTRHQLLHTIGNLTLLTQPMNSALSCGPFQQKRPEITTHSLLRLNAYFQQDVFLAPTATWSEEEIVARGNKLFTLAKSIWPYPEM
jgi:uncharacterized protein with ParB-like and HNH nuclease domain